MCQGPQEEQNRQNYEKGFIKSAYTGELGSLNDYTGEAKNL